MITSRHVKVPVSKCYLRKLDDGIIVVVDADGVLIGSTINVVVDNGCEQMTTATVTLVPEGWYEDIQNAD